MVFKAVSGVEERVWDLYNSPSTSNEFQTAALDVTDQLRGHYKNGIVLNWQSFAPSQVNTFYLSTLTLTLSSRELGLRCGTLSLTHARTHARTQTLTLARTHAPTHARRRKHEAVITNSLYLCYINNSNTTENDFKQLFIRPQAKVIVYEGGVSKKELLFDATGTDKLNWFSEGKLISSSWTDIKTEPRNYFSIQGDSPRNFYINRNYGGCHVDAGWLVAGAGIHCSWETSAARKNKVLYSKLDTYTSWSTDGEACLLF